MRAYLLKAVKRLKKEASWRSADLKKQCIELVSVLEGSAEAEGANTDEVVIEEARSAAPLFDSADPYAHIFKAALESRQSRLMEISLDALHYLIEHDYLKGKEVVNPETNLTLMDDILETVCKCEDEYDEVIQVQKIKLLLTAISSTHCTVHGSTLLISIRSIFHIHLVSKHMANKTSAKAALQQILDVLSQRMETQSIRTRGQRTGGRAGDDQADGDGMSVEGYTQHSSETDLAQRQASEEVLSFPGITAEVAIACPVEDASPAASAEDAATGVTWALSDGLSSFESVYLRDVFLVFRAFCRLSMKGLHDEADDDVPTDSIALKNKLLSLELILHILKQCSASFVADPRILYVIRTYLCVSLLSNCTSHEGQVVSLSLQVFLALMENFKAYLKSELEIFITTIFLRILESENSSIDHKMRVLEVFIDICKDHILLVEIFVNYDCDFEAIDLFKRIVDGFAKIAKSQSKVPTETHNLRLMGLEGLVVVLKSLLNSSCFGIIGEKDPPSLSTVENFSRNSLIKSPDYRRYKRTSHGGSNDELDSNHDNSEDHSPKEQQINVTGSDAVEKFDRKKKIHEEIETGILKFNLNPKKGLAYLVSLGHLEMDPKSVALFFRQYQDRLDKTVVGDYLGREREYEQGFCIKVLNEYVDSMEFTNMKFDSAIRYFLGGFRLPGEAQKIDRLMEKFAERYYLQNRNEFASADMAFILAFSTIMLQTNLHNPAIRDDKRMNKEQFIKQNKGISPDGELSDELLSEIFDRILVHPISLNKDDAKVRKAKGEEAGTLRNLLSSADSKRKELFSDERREMVKTGEALFKQKLKSKLGNTFVHTSKESDEEYVRPMFEVAWAPMIGVFSQIIETCDMDLQAELCIQGLVYGVRLAGRLDFGIVLITYMNALSKFTSMESTKEIGIKNVECIKALIAVALSEGDFLGESWVDVLKCVSHLDRLSLIVHDMRSDDASNSSSASKKVQRTADKDPLTKLFLGLTKAESMRINDESNAQLLENKINFEDLDRIFIHSQSLSGDAVFIFVKVLCAVSLSEIEGVNPRTFTLQKLVEVADFNMGSRPRLDWDRIWGLLAAHFTTVGLHKNHRLAMYAVDSLKQLSIKFLQKPELANFNFQRKFLKPFETILAKSSSFQIKDLIIRCLDIMIQACAANIRSGWRSIFSIFEVAAASDKYEVSAIAFEVTERLIKTQFDLLIYDFVELMNCLVAFVSGPHSLLSLAAISHVATCAVHLADGDVSQALDSQHVYSDTLNISWEKSSQCVDEAIGEDTSVFRLWWPLLLGLSTRASDSRSEIRSKALETLHKILAKYGSLFSAQTWNVIFKGVLFPMIDSVLTDTSTSVVSQYPTQNIGAKEEHKISSIGYQVLSVCLSLFHQHRFRAENGSFILLPELLTLLEDCICQDGEGLAIIGVKSLKEFILGFIAGENAADLDTCSADLICSRLESCVTRNLLFDFADAGCIRLREADCIVHSDLALEGVTTKPSRQVAVVKKDSMIRTAYGDGTLLDILPETLELPARSKVLLAHGGVLYTSELLLISTKDNREDEDADERPFTAELLCDQAWIQLAGAAMTSMVVTLDFIAAIGDISADPYMPLWSCKNMATFLLLLHSCHSHAHAFNANSSLRINLKLAGFMKFSGNAAMLPHLLDQEILSLMQILLISSKMTMQSDRSTFELLSLWFSRAGTVALTRYAFHDTAIITSSDKFALDQLLSYATPSTFVLDYILNSMTDEMLASNIHWIAPALSPLIVVADRKIRDLVSKVYEKRVNPFIARFC